VPVTANTTLDRLFTRSYFFSSIRNAQPTMATNARVQLGDGPETSSARDRTPRADTSGEGNNVRADKRLSPLLHLAKRLSVLSDG
jgi:hypothetical protein